MKSNSLDSRQNKAKQKWCHYRNQADNLNASFQIHLEWKKNFFWLLMLQPDTKKMLNVDSQKKSQVVNRVFWNESVVFSTRKLTVPAWQNLVEKFFSSLFAPKRKSNANSTTRLWVTHKRKKPKNKTHDSLFFVSD